jgi:hypothetical protein
VKVLSGMVALVVVLVAVVVVVVLVVVLVVVDVTSLFFLKLYENLIIKFNLDL